jgi:hypothetical protein
MTAIERLLVLQMTSTMDQEEANAQKWFAGVAETDIMGVLTETVNLAKHQDRVQSWIGQLALLKLMQLTRDHCAAKEST